MSCGPNKEFPWIVIGIVVLLLLMSMVKCSHATEIGIASYYQLDGRRTASGVIFRSNSDTCAHRSHKFGSVLRITTTGSGRSILCTVRDRGPFVRGRIVDLSVAGANQLGIRSTGTAKVRIDYVSAR